MSQLIDEGVVVQDPDQSFRATGVSSKKKFSLDPNNQLND